MKQMMAMVLVLGAVVVAALVFAWQGVAMHARVSVEEAQFHALQNSYFTLAKADRDAAPTGSELNDQLVRIQNYPSTLLELKLVGIGKILTGIFLVLLAIALMLFVMPARLAALLRAGK